MAEAPHSWPRHVAVIMDGNGRWAKQRNLPRIEGHKAGIKSVQSVVEACRSLRRPGAPRRTRIGSQSERKSQVAI